MHTNSTTVICFQKTVAVGQINNKTSQDNSTQVIAVIRASPKSQLWIPYVLIGFGCVVFLAVHFWCYHKRNRARYLRKREEIRVKCGLLERRRIATLMMARNRSAQHDAENNPKEESEENALLANPFYNQDNDYFRSQSEENSYYEALLNEKAGITKPHIGCCLTCSVSMPAGMKSTTTTSGKEKRDGLIQQSKSFCDSRFANLAPSDQFLQFREDVEDTSKHGSHLGEEGNVSIRLDNDNDDYFPTDCLCTSPDCSSTNYEDGQCIGDFDLDENYDRKFVSDREGWGYSVNEMTPVESDFVLTTKANPFQLKSNNERHNPESIAPHFQNLMSNNDYDIISSPENSGHFNRGKAHPCLEMEIIPADETLDTISNVNIVSDGHNDVDNDCVEDLQVSSIHPIQSQPVETDGNKQFSLKTPSLRVLNPSLVFENLHYTAK